MTEWLNWTETSKGPDSLLFQLYKFSKNIRLCLVAQSCPILWDPIECSPPGSSVHGDSPDKNTVFQGIFPIQGSNPGLPHCRWVLYHLSYQGSPRTLEWVAYPFASGSSWPRSQTGVSCIAGRFFTSWATREAQHSIEAIKYYVGSCWLYDFIYTGDAVM